MPTPQGYIPLIVESHEGRPTKVEGNPSYIPYGGGTNIYAQASSLRSFTTQTEQVSSETSE